MMMPYEHTRIPRPTAKLMIRSRQAASLYRHTLSCQEVGLQLGLTDKQVYALLSRALDERWLKSIELPYFHDKGADIHKRRALYRLAATQGLQGILHTYPSVRTMKELARRAKLTPVALSQVLRFFQLSPAVGQALRVREHTRAQLHTRTLYQQLITTEGQHPSKADLLAHHRLLATAIQKAWGSLGAFRRSLVPSAPSSSENERVISGPRPTAPIFLAQYQQVEEILRLYHRTHSFAQIRAHLHLTKDKIKQLIQHAKNHGWLIDQDIPWETHNDIRRREQA